ncbi:MAG: nicotinate phosphoribosyltransferase [Candidatus Saccharimonadaceae bacterium]
MSEFLTFPTPETERRLSDRLDYYKLTMGQVALERFPEASVTFTMKNRAGEHPLGQYVNPVELEARLTAIRDQGFTPEEIAYFASLETQTGGARFDAPYLDYLADLTLSDVRIDSDTQTGDLHIESTGPWANTSLWETVVMSEVNELYYQNLIKETGLDMESVLTEGDRRLTDKIERLKGTDIKFADFGTRRRFSADWQSHNIERLAKELPDNFIGTSNPWFAYKYNLAPIGTYAHEMPMVYSALADQEGRNPLDGHAQMMHDWENRYKGELSIALTDTFTSNFFFSDFTPEQAEAWRGLRHDSGDAVEFGERAIAFYEANDVDPTEKTIIFSDGLDIDTIFELNEHFKGRVKVLFGWGTSLMNDMGLRPNNFVMKATAVNGVSTVKLSDAEGKHTGPEEQVDRYAQLVKARQEISNAYESLIDA